MAASSTWRAAVLSVALFAAFVLAWHLATRGSGPTTQMDPEYAKLMGVTATQGKSAMPGPLDVAAKIWEHLKNPFYDRGSNDKGLGIQLAYSIARVGIGYLLAVADADQYRVRRRRGAPRMARRGAHAGGRHLAARLHDHSAGRRAHHS